jgi:probable DNA metabolism protein
METGTVYIYDGNFQGFLTAAGEALDTGLPVQDICRATQGQSALFAQMRHVLSHRQKAELLWRKLERKSPSLPRLIYFSFLSEKSGIELFIFKYLHLLFNIGDTEATELPEWRQRLESVARRVELEKRELESTVPFRTTRDGILCAWVNPLHNTLPLLTRHFKNRYAGQSWMIYDVRRNYGIYCHGGMLELVGCRAEALGSFAASPDRERVGNPEIFGIHTLQSLLLPKVVQQPQAAIRREPQRMRSAV